MKELSERQWSDVAPRLINHACVVCGEHCISHEPRYVEIGDVDVLIATCSYCGHIEMFDVGELTKMADAMDCKLRKQRLR